MYTHWRRDWGRGRGRESESCCFLKDAAPACMLKLALNVWITHGSSHRGFSSHSLESGGVCECFHLLPNTHAHTNTQEEAFCWITNTCHPSITRHVLSFKALKKNHEFDLKDVEMQATCSSVSFIRFLFWGDSVSALHLFNSAVLASEGWGEERIC